MSTPNNQTRAKATALAIDRYLIDTLGIAISEAESAPIVAIIDRHFATLTAQLEAATRKQPINTHIRLFDLVRQQRAELHDDGLITSEEYAWLSGGAGMAVSDKGGSPSPRRLEDYDDMRKQLEAAKGAASALYKITSMPDYWDAGAVRRVSLKALARCAAAGLTDQGGNKG